MSVRVRGVVLKPGDRVVLLTNATRRPAFFMWKFRHFLRLNVPLNDRSRSRMHVNVLDHHIRFPGETDSDVSLESVEGIQERFHNSKRDLFTVGDVAANFFTGGTDGEEKR